MYEKEDWRSLKMAAELVELAKLIGLIGEKTLSSFIVTQEPVIDFLHET